MPDTVATDQGSGAPNRFCTTRWSVVLSCSRSQPREADAALAELCKTYWRPIFAFICQRGYSVPDAQDLAQDFFVQILDGSLLQRADPDRGRFRCLLLKALQYFLSDQRDRQNALKRGGNHSFISWDEWMAEAPSQLVFPGQQTGEWPAERIYDVRWAATVAERALRRLGEECELRGKRRVFDALGHCLTAEREDISYQKYARALGVAETAIKRLVHQLRERYRALLREEVGQTVESPEELEEELRYLCAALAAAEGRPAV